MTAVFRSLPQYDAHALAEFEDDGMEEVERVLRKGVRGKRGEQSNTAYATAYAAYIAAAIYPQNFDLTRMVNVLSDRFTEVHAMKPKGRANVVTKLLQTKPPLICNLYHHKYKWTDEINPRAARSRIDEIIRNKFRRET